MKVVALLDRPNTYSMSMRGFVTKEDAGYVLRGVRDWEGHVLQEARLCRLIDEGDAIETENAPELDTLPEHAAAWWVGQDFHSLADKVDLPPTFDVSEKMVARGGVFGIEPANLISETLDEWHAEAFLSSLRTGDPLAAELMTYTQPLHEKTRAAVLWTTERSRWRQELRFFLQTDGIGNPSDTAITELERHLEEVTQDGLRHIAQLDEHKAKALRAGVISCEYQGIQFAIGTPGHDPIHRLIDGVSRFRDIQESARTDLSNFLAILDRSEPDAAAMLVDNVLVVRNRQRRDQGTSKWVRYLSAVEHELLRNRLELLSKPDALQKRFRSLSVKSSKEAV